MGVTLKSVNKGLADSGTKAELVKGAGYFIFQGGETEDWIDRTVAVATINSLTLEQWLGEYKRLKVLNDDLAKGVKHAAPRPAKTEKQPHESPVSKPPAPAEPARKEPCSLKPKLLAELDEAHRVLAGVEEQEVRAAREGRISEFGELSADATRERAKFDRALLAIRHHIQVHGCS
jgi:hypothetical protein